MFSFILKSVIHKIRKSSQCSPYSHFPSNSYQAYKNFVYITSVLGLSTGIEVVGGVLDALAFLTSDAPKTIFLAMLEPGFSSTFVKPLTETAEMETTYCQQVLQGK